ERRLAGLCAGLAALDRAADLPPHIDRPVPSDADAVGGLRPPEYRAEAGGAADRAGASIDGSRDGAQPRSCRGDCRPIAGARLAQQREPLLVGGCGGLDVLVRDLHLRFELTEYVVVEDLPPGSAAERIGRLTGLPVADLLEAGGGSDLRP